VPANVPGLYWRPMTGFAASAKPEDVVLENMAAPGVPLGLTAQMLPNGDYLLVPTVALVDGASYRLTDRSVCAPTGEHGPQVVFSVGPQAPLPSSLGTLSATAPAVLPLTLATTSGSCLSEVTVAQSTIELVESTAAAAWLDVLHFETRVDGRPWHYVTSIGGWTPPGTSPAGRARDVVYAICASKDPGVGEGVAAGTHTVTMQATLPGTTQVVMSSELMVTLACDEDERATQGAGGCSSGGPGAAWMSLALLALLRRRSRRATTR
jgi:hypothetical protein